MRLLPRFPKRAESQKEAQRKQAEAELAIATDALASLVGELRAALSEAQRTSK
ncbi:hypothetical protein [Pararhodobacter aggregans]|uniref:hypothetical protein n=1 Tax=Pararhodobacter aggregans TaxID=404875 RepID=UPI000D4BBDF5|nr:hypothetical protein [Pararhodobacter aggregans]PTX01048.1 hypothetical protein C8N33_1085 [Pararhodobacter aggregans]